MQLLSETVKACFERPEEETDWSEGLVEGSTKRKGIEDDKVLSSSMLVARGKPVVVVLSIVMFKLVQVGPQWTWKEPHRLVDLKRKERLACEEWEA